MMFVGLTALSVEISTNVSTLASEAASAQIFVPCMLFDTLVTGLCRADAIVCFLLYVHTVLIFRVGFALSIILIVTTG